MPRIPQIGADEGVPEPRNFHPLGPQMFGEQLGQGLEQLGSSISEAISRSTAIGQQVEAHRASTDAFKQLSDYSEELKRGPVNDGTQTDPTTGKPLPVGSPQLVQIPNPNTGQMDWVPKGPPPPEQHAELMQAKIDQIREQAGDKLFGAGLRQFSSTFETHANSALLQTKASAAELINNQTFVKFRNDINMRAQVLSQMEPLARAHAEKETEDYFDKMQAANIITPQQSFQGKQDFAHQVDLGAFDRLVKNNPEAAIASLNNGEFPGLKGDAAGRAYDRARVEQYNQQVRENRQRESDIRDLEKERKETGEGIYKDFLAKSAPGGGGLKMSDVLANKDNLSPGQFEKAIEMATGKNRPSNSDTMLHLSQMIDNGDPNFEAAKERAAKNGTLDYRGYNYLTDRANNVETNLKKKPGYSEAVQWAHSQMAPTFAKEPKRQGEEGDIKKAFDDYNMQNPKASRDDRFNEMQTLMSRNEQANQAAVFRQIPSYYGGTRAALLSETGDNEGLRTAAKKLEQDVKSGKLTPDLGKQYAKELNTFWRQHTVPKTKGSAQ